MGFGWLFLGYFFLFDLPYGEIAVDVIPDLWGFLLLLIAAWKLAPYHAAFLGMRRTLYPLLVFETVKYAVQWILFATDWQWQTVLSVVDFCKLPFLIAMQYFLLRGLAALSGEVGLTKSKHKCERNLQIGGVYYLFHLLAVILTTSSLLPETPTGIWIPVAYALWAVELFSWVWIALNLIRIATCYLQIVLPDDPAPAKQTTNDKGEML